MNTWWCVRLNKCIQDFEKCDFFEYYGYEKRDEADIDSDDEPEDYSLLKSIKSKISTIRKQSTIVRRDTILQSPKTRGERRRTEFKALQTLKESRILIKDNHKFYEVDLSDEDDKREKKAIMNFRSNFIHNFIFSNFNL